jgi:FMN phosphatase YigB (HAD superfamily)
MEFRHNVVFLIDVDNTLLDNDRIVSDIMLYLEHEVGPVRQQQYWTIFEAIRARLGYADYLGALQQYRLENPRDSHLLRLSSFLVDYPFAARLYPDALEALDHLRPFGPTVILTDGDVVFQPLKVERSGLAAAVDGRVLIYVHKEEMLSDVEERYPAERYVMIDDKLRILAAMKEVWGPRLITVFPRQGHYAEDPQVLANYPAAEVSIARIGDLATADINEFLLGSHGAPP